MSKILFLPQDKIYIFKPLCNFSIYYIYSMQKAVNDVIDIFTSENMEICRWLISSKTLASA